MEIIKQPETYLIISIRSEGENEQSSTSYVFETAPNMLQLEVTCSLFLGSDCPSTESARYLDPLIKNHSLEN